jgi:uncharacterized phage protein (TIGR01671 family)
MGREIKFHYVIKDEDGKEQYITDPYDVYLTLEGDLYTSDHDKLDAKLIQFTGLKDKNSKEIFEGDILKCKRTKISHKDEFDWAGGIKTFFKNSVIEWWESFSNIGYRLRDGKGKTMMVKPSSLSKMEVEVIGNIYENPELLEVKE